MICLLLQCDGCQAVCEVCVRAGGVRGASLWPHKRTGKRAGHSGWGTVGSSRGAPEHVMIPTLMWMSIALGGLAFESQRLARTQTDESAGGRRPALVLLGVLAWTCSSRGVQLASAILFPQSCLLPGVHAEAGPHHPSLSS